MANNHFTNKEIIQNLMEQMEKLDCRLKETEEIINKYNGLRKKIHSTEDRVGKLQEKFNKRVSADKGKSVFLSSIRVWGGWIVAILSLLVYIIDLLI